MNKSAYYIEQAKRCSRLANCSLDDVAKARLLMMASENAHMAAGRAAREEMDARTDESPHPSFVRAL